MIEHGSGKNHEAKTRLLPNMFASPEEGLLLFQSKHFVTMSQAKIQQTCSQNTKTRLQKFCNVESVEVYLYYRLIPFRCTLHSMSAQVVDDVKHPRTLIGGDKLSHLTAQPMLAPIYGQIVHRA